jgi:hypothetical protein
MSTGCSQCDDKRSCGNWHLYAIELDVDKCLNNNLFKRKYGEDAVKAYYVGKTTHTIECRYNEHSGRKKGKFSCPCFTDEPVLRNKKKQVRFVKHHLPGGLRPEITVDANPVVLLPSKLFKEERLKRSAEADVLEGALAEALSNREGHYAHWG